MPYFSHGEAKNKLILLYIVNRCQILPTRDQLYRSAILNSKMEYFAFMQAIGELEEDGMLVSVKKAFGDCYGLTDTGRDALSMFEKSLPYDERRKLDAYLDENSKSFAREREITSRIEKEKDGGTILELMIVEGAESIFSLRISVASEEQALEMRSHWENGSELIYNTVWDTLLSKQPNR